jgi:2-iminobutanoate/2-iminopropanoate deaminase
MTELTIISTKDAPEAIGPYSQAVRCGQLLFCSGQIPLDPKTMQIVDGDVKAQAEQVCRNIAGVLKAAGLDFNRVIKATCFLKNMNDFVAFNEVYSKYFGATKPARSTVEVARLPKDVLVEIEVIASF